MKSKQSLQTAVMSALAASLLFLCGCFDTEKLIVWSPDGKLATVLAEKGLFLSDADGKISGLQVPNVMAAAWFNDSRRIALACTSKYTNWNELQQFLPQTTRDKIKLDSGIALNEFKLGHNSDQVSAILTNLNDNEKSAVALYLKTVDGAKQAAGTNWSLIEKAECEVVALQIGTIVGDRVDLGPILSREFGGVIEIRVSPGQTAIAYVAALNDEPVLRVLPTDGSTSGQTVSEHTSCFPDWSADGRSLIFMKSTGEWKNEELVLGSLSRRTVLNQDGHIQLQDKSDDLAGLLFYPYSKVRCLADGRIIFSSMNVHLPSTSADMPQHQQLFVLDPEKQAILTPLIPQGILNDTPQELSSFEISPDGKRISMLDDKLCVVMNVAAGTLEVVSTNYNNKVTPVWRSTNELTFATGSGTNAADVSQVAIWTSGKTRIISSNWPAEVRKGFLEK